MYRCCDALQQAMSRIYRQAGIKGGSSHTGRRTLAARVLAQTGRVEDVQQVLGHQEAHETGIKDIIKMTFFWSDKILAPEVRNSLLLGWLGEHRPCMTMVVVKGLARPDLLVEIDVSAIGKDFIPPYAP